MQQLDEDVGLLHRRVLAPHPADAGDDARLEERRLDRDRSLADQAREDQHRVPVLALVEVEAGEGLEHVPPALLAADALELLLGALGRADVAVGADVVLAGLLHQGELAVLRHRRGGHLAEEDHRPEELQGLVPVAEVVVDPALLVERVAVDGALLVLGRVLVGLERPLQVLVPLVLVGPLEVVLAEGHPAVGDEARLRVVLDQRPVGLERLGVVPVPLLEVLGQEVEHLVEARVLGVALDDRLVEGDRLGLQLLLLPLQRLLLGGELVDLPRVAAGAQLDQPVVAPVGLEEVELRVLPEELRQPVVPLRRLLVAAAPQLDQLLEAGDLLLPLAGDVHLDAAPEGVEVERRADRDRGALLGLQAAAERGVGGDRALLPQIGLLGRRGRLARRLRRQGHPEHQGEPGHRRPRRHHPRPPLSPPDQSNPPPQRDAEDPGFSCDRGSRSLQPLVSV